MIARIVESKYLLIDSVEDLLGTKLKPLALPGDLTLWSRKSFLQHFEYESTKQNFVRLFNRTERILFSDSKWLDVFGNPKLMVEMMYTSAILEDEFVIKFFSKVLGEMVPVHLSRESYFPQFITPLCYNANFSYPAELEKL